MPAYVELDGIPCHANEWLLKKVLRKEWDFKGLVTSDFGGIEQLWNKHFVAGTRRTQQNLPSMPEWIVISPFGRVYPHLVQLVKDSTIRVQDLDYL